MNKREKEVFQAQLDSEAKVLKALEKQYKEALRDIEERIKILQSDELTQSKVYQLNYQKALKGQVKSILDKLHGDEFSTIQQYLHDSYQSGFIGTMYSINAQGIPIVVPIDQQSAVKAIITDSQINEDLYTHLGVDIGNLKKTISAEITRGIASNMPFADIARNIQSQTRAPFGRAKTIVRTEAHRIQQASAADARDAAKARGCDVVKQWDSTMDGDTRPTHKRLDGQIRETDKPFEMDRKKAMYPGDFGKPEEDCNCRCVALTRAKWALDEDELKQLKERAKVFGLDKKDDFKTFEEKYLKAAETLEKSGKSGIIVLEEDPYYESLSKEDIASRYKKPDGSNLLDESFLHMPIAIQREAVRGFDKAISMYGEVLPQRIKAGDLSRRVFALYSPLYKTITLNTVANAVRGEAYATMIHEMTHHAGNMKLFNSSDVFKGALQMLGLRSNSKNAINLKIRTVGLSNKAQWDNTDEIVAYAIERQLTGRQNELTEAIYAIMKERGIIK